MKRILVFATAVLAACGGGDSSGPSGDINVAGTWNYQANISNSGVALSCIATGTLTITQQGSQFSGQATNSTGLCTGPGGSAPFDANGPITGGTVSGNSITYTDGICTYTGNASGNPINKVAGTVTCNFPIQGQNIPMTGTWQISR